jgi:hypothetical protein
MHGDGRVSAHLAAIQERILAAVLDGTSLVDATAPEDGIDFYRASVAATLRESLAATCPVVERLVGAAFFGEAASAYAREHPSASGDLHRFGEAFAEFLERYAPARSLPYLPDVARLEWAIHESAHAADPRDFDFEALSRVAQSERPALRARLAPPVRLVRSPWPVLAIWEANQPGREGVPDRTDGPDHLVVRREQGVTVTRIDAEAWDLLRALALGEPLERAASMLGAHAERLPALLAEWTAGAVIEGFHHEVTAA